MQKAARFIVIAALCLVATVNQLYADSIAISSSSSANSAINFGSPPSESNNDVLIAVVSGMFGLAGVVLTAFIAQNRKSRTGARSRNAKARGKSD
ncbi:MAG: hypothetical protein V4697_00905 [Patescibacteria group bacterium]